MGWSSQLNLLAADCIAAKKEVDAQLNDVQAAVDEGPARLSLDSHHTLRRWGSAGICAGRPLPMNAQWGSNHDEN